MVTVGARGSDPALWSTANALLAAVVGTVAALGSVEAQVSRPEPAYEGNDRIEEWSERRILVVTPHPDDETFTSGGTLAILAANGNDIRVVVYTTDNAGSRDPEMTKDRLKAIRRAESSAFRRKTSFGWATTTACWSTSTAGT